MTHRRIQATLPVGALGPRGQRHRDATLVPLTGKAELAASDNPNPLAAAIELLVGTLTQLGGLDARAIDSAVVGSLTPADRDFAVMQLDRLTFGDVRFQTVTCPECGERMDVRLDLASLEPPPPPPALTLQVSASGTQTIELRLPTAADQAALFDAATGHESGTLLRWCASVADRDTLEALAPDVAEGLAAQLVAAMHTWEATLDLSCVECGEAFAYSYDPVATFVNALAAGRRVLLQEVHVLASRYHWTLADILDLPRPLRRELLDVVEPSPSE